MRGDAVDLPLIDGFHPALGRLAGAAAGELHPAAEQFPLAQRGVAETGAAHLAEARRLGVDGIAVRAGHRFARGDLLRDRRLPGEVGRVFFLQFAAAGLLVAGAVIRGPAIRAYYDIIAVVK